MHSDVGKRVRLISTSNSKAPVKPGATGIIWHVTQFSTRRVKWDNGSKGDLDPEKDKWEVLEES